MSNFQKSWWSSQKLPVLFYSLFTLCFRIPNPSSAAPVHPSISGSSPFVGYFVFPHGGITLNPDTHDFDNDASHDGSKEEALGLQNAMRSAAKALVKLAPDFVILSTPHGFFLDKHYLFLATPSMEGNGGWEWSNFTANFAVASQESVKLYVDLFGAGNPVELLTLGIGNSPMPLHWGEVVPWWFVQQAYKDAGLSPPPVIYSGQPPSKNLDQLQKLGSDIVESVTLNWPEKRFVLSVSGDLAHTHSSSPKAPYPHNPSSTIFDGHIKAWGQLDRNKGSEETSRSILLEKAWAVADAAGSCGYTGLLLLHSMISREVKEGRKLKAHFYDYAAPTYFGMTVTSWVPEP